MQLKSYYSYAFILDNFPLQLKFTTWLWKIRPYSIPSLLISPTSSHATPHFTHYIPPPWIFLQSVEQSTRPPLEFCTCCFCYLENYSPYSLLMHSFSLIFQVSLKFHLLREDFFRDPSKGDLSHSLPLFSLRSFFISFIAPHMAGSYFIYIFIYLFLVLTSRA